jgi:hypothetical protein
MCGLTDNEPQIIEFMKRKQIDITGIADTIVGKEVT